MNLADAQAMLAHSPELQAEIQAAARRASRAREHRTSHRPRAARRLCTAASTVPMHLSRCARHEFYLSPEGRHVQGRRDAYPFRLTPGYRGVPPLASLFHQPKELSP